MSAILITGAGSAIAQATARLWAKEGHSFFLIDRDAAKLKIVADDLKVRGAKIAATAVADLNDTGRYAALLQEADQVLSGLTHVLIAHGTLPVQKEAQADSVITQMQLTINFLSPVLLLTHLANYFEAKGGGVLGVISSVAGDRGRESNYIYGAAKGGLTLFTQGLRLRLRRRGIAVITIKPGFVDTPMTRNYKKGLLWVKPERVARDIKAAFTRHRSGEIYTPWFWRFIMLVIRLMPEPIFRRLPI